MCGRRQAACTAARTAAGARDLVALVRGSRAGCAQPGRTFGRSRCGGARAAGRPARYSGDIHHGNVLDAGARGWLAIDPKGLLGERTFDFVNILRNPDAATALAPGRFDRQVDLLADTAALDRQRLLKWTLAFAGLSASWHLADGEPADLDLAVAGLAAAALGDFRVGRGGKPR